jgi:hypothetical protein
MEINLGSIKIDKAVTVTFYILSLVLPVPFGYIIIDFGSYEKIDIFKLLLLSISVSGCSVLIHFILTFACFGFTKAALLMSANKKNDPTVPTSPTIAHSENSNLSPPHYSAENQSTIKQSVKGTSLEDAIDVKELSDKTKDLIIAPVLKAAKANSTTVGETALYLAFVINNFSAIAVIINLIRLKFYLHLPSIEWLRDSFDTYFLVCLIWYSIYFLLLLISINIIRRAIKTRKKLNKSMMDLLNIVTEFQRSQIKDGAVNGTIENPNNK